MSHIYSTISHNIKNRDKTVAAVLKPLQLELEDKLCVVLMLGNWFTHAVSDESSFSRQSFSISLKGNNNQDTTTFPSVLSN